MIFNEDNVIDGISFDRRLEPSDWRYSAAALGMKRFFDFHEIPHRFSKRNFFYNSKYIEPVGNDEKYLEYAEEYFSKSMHHVNVENLLKNEATDENIKQVNTKLSANTIMKKVFAGIKYDGSNKDEILKIIDENRYTIVKDTFINGKSMYRKFVNLSKFRFDKGEVCRLLGYYVDTGRKLKSLGFGFDKNARTYNDEIEFDFIPFAFSKGVESIFINNNIDTESIITTNENFKNKLQNLNDWRGMFYDYAKGSEYIDYDVEIIKKTMELEKEKNNFYESIHLRQQAVNIFKELYNRNDRDNLAAALKANIKINENYYLRILDIVTENIVNLCDLDNLIDILFKIGNQSFVSAMLIRINTVIYTHLNRLEVNMDNNKYLNSAIRVALETVNKFKNTGNENKIRTYRHKLISTLVANDYDRFIEIMLQFSSYTQTPFVFMHDLIRDFEANKNLAYAFVNSLIENDYKVKDSTNLKEASNE